MSTATDPTAVCWFRRDLRLADNPALAAAIAYGRVVPLFILDDGAPENERPGGAARWWLHHSLAALRDRIARGGGTLVLRRGNPAEILPEIAGETGASNVVWNRCYEPGAIRRDAALQARLRTDGIACDNHNSALLFEPWTIAAGTGGPYKVFTPFWRACLAAPAPPRPAPAPAVLPGPRQPVRSENLDDWDLLPRAPDWAQGFHPLWQPGEDGARARLDAFAAGPLRNYGRDRDRMDHAATSNLSAHLHWGEIGPRQIWHRMHRLAAMDPNLSKDADKFLAEIGWREFAHHLLFHFPDIATRNFRAAFDPFRWRRDADALRAWQRGATGFPIVDAGMRQLWRTGTLHNRARMIVASFLTKHLLIDWREGADWFWDTLCDADLANNSAGWQWVAGSGADAAPYFRIFNPVSQGEKFDPSGEYVLRFVPELAPLPAPLIHKPWTADEAALRRYGVVLGRTYPRPIVDHSMARQRALAAYKALRL